jgi:micrococcal nuclease
MNTIYRFLYKNCCCTSVPDITIDIGILPQTIPNTHKDTNTYINTPASVQTHMDNTPTIHSLDNVVYKDTAIYIPDIPFGKVVKVYDADTITIANRISVGNSYSEQVYRFNVRLNGIDTPEIKSANPTTKARAIQARDVLSEMIFGKIVILKNVKLEKYGRLLADVYLDDLHLNNWLIENNYAVKYDGGTKMIPTEWEA